VKCFDIDGWAPERTSGRVKIDWWGNGMVICLERGCKWFA